MSKGRSFWALLLAEGVSTTGSQLSNVAIPWFVLTSTGSATRMSIVLTAELAGVALAGLPGGVLAARLGPRRTMLICDAARAPTLALVPLLYWAGLLSLPVLMALAFIIGAALSPYVASQRTILSLLVGLDERRLGQSAALLQAATRAALLIGPVLGGVLIAGLGAPTVLLLDAGTYAAGFVLVGVFVSVAAQERVVVPPRIWDGIGQIVRDRLLAAWTLASSAEEAAFQAMIVALPVLVYTRFDARPALVGWLLAAFGGGALLGNLAAARLLSRVACGRLARLAAVAYILPLWLLAAADSPLAAIVALALAGLANGVLNPALYALQTARIPARRLTATNSAFVTVTLAAGAIGLALAGSALQRLGTGPVLAAVAVLQTVGSLIFFFVTSNGRLPAAAAVAAP